MLTFFLCILFVLDDISGLRGDNVLEERDPEYDAMLNKMLGRVTTKPGGKLEMGEVRLLKAVWLFVFQFAICHKQVLWTYGTTNRLFLNWDLHTYDSFIVSLKLIALSLIIFKGIRVQLLLFAPFSLWQSWLSFISLTGDGMQQRLSNQ